MFDGPDLQQFPHSENENHMGNDWTWLANGWQLVGEWFVKCACFQLQDYSFNKT